MKTKNAIALTETERKYAQAVVNNKTTAETFGKRKSTGADNSCA